MYLLISAFFLPFFVLILIWKTNKAFLWNSVKKYSFNVQEPYKTFLINGEKIIEWRLNKWKFKEAKIWDIFYLDDENIEFEVWTKREYPTFEKMLEEEWLKNVLPDKDDIKKWIEEVYYKFYTKNDEEKYGVVAIEFKKLS